MISLSLQLPIQRSLSICTSLVLLSSLCFTTPATAQDDALNESAMISPLAQRSLMMDLDRVGSKLIAVGERGHILISKDGANSWEQVEAPVRVTLNASFFIDEQNGWAVGHDGVLLRTNDGGNSWTKLLDGNVTNQLMLEHARQLVSQKEAELQTATAQQVAALEEQLESLSFFADDAQIFTEEGPSRPFLDLWFKDKNEGFIIGAFGLMLHTDDGGNSWTPWFEHIENPEGFHLNAIRKIGEQLFITAEAGGIYRSDDWGNSWQMLDSPYEGSFFGIVGQANGPVIAYGLRGNAFFSDDSGDSWTAIDTSVDASLFGATQLDDGTTVLVGAGGVTLYVNLLGQLIKKTQSPMKLPLSAVVTNARTGLVMAGLGGIQVPAANHKGQIL